MAEFNQPKTFAQEIIVDINAMGNFLAAPDPDARWTVAVFWQGSRCWASHQEWR